MSQARTLDISLGSLTRALFAVLALLFLLLIRDILSLVLLAVVLTASISPLLRWFDHQGIPRSLGVASILLLLSAGVAVMVIILTPPVAHQLRELNAGLPKLLEQARLVLTAVGVTVPADFGSGLTGSVGSLQSAIQSFGSVVLSGLKTISSFMGSILIVFILTFYFSLSKEGMKGLFTAVAPSDALPFLMQLQRRIEDRLGSWFRGQLFISTLAGVLSFIGLSLLHVPYALLLAILGGLTMFIPIVSAFLAGVPTVLAAGTVSTGTAIATTIFLLALHQIIANALVPKVIGRAVQLNPVVIFIVMLAGAALSGVVGLLLAVPVAAAVAVTVDLLRRT